VDCVLHLSQSLGEKYRYLLSLSLSRQMVALLVPLLNGDQDLLCPRVRDRVP